MVAILINYPIFVHSVFTYCENQVRKY